MNIRKSFLTVGLFLFCILPRSAQADGGTMQNDDRLLDPQYSHSLAFGPDGRRVAAGYESGVIKIWDLATGKEFRSFKGHDGAAIAIVFSPDGKHILSGSMDHTLKLWEASTGAMIRTFTGHRGGVLSVAFGPDGRSALSGSEDRTLRLWDLASGKEVRSYKGHDGYSGSAVAFSPDGTQVLMGNTLWEKETGKELRTFKATGLDGYWKDSVQFGPEGKTLWIGETLLETATGKAIVVLAGSQGSTLHKIFAYSADGGFAVSGNGGNYGTSDLWDTKAYRAALPTAGKSGHLRPIASLSSTPYPIIALAISPDSRYILVRTAYVADKDPDTLFLWDIKNPDDPVRTFKAR